MGFPAVVRVNKGSKTLLKALKAGPATGAVKHTPLNGSLIATTAEPPRFAVACTDLAWLGMPDVVTDNMTEADTAAAIKRCRGDLPIRTFFIGLSLELHRTFCDGGHYNDVIASKQMIEKGMGLCLQAQN
jgi:hypothetical protein